MAEVGVIEILFKILDIICIYSGNALNYSTIVNYSTLMLLVQAIEQVSDFKYEEILVHTKTLSTSIKFHVLPARTSLEGEGSKFLQVREAV